MRNSSGLLAMLIPFADRKERTKIHVLLSERARMEAVRQYRRPAGNGPQLGMWANGHGTCSLLTVPHQPPDKPNHRL